VPDLNSVTRKLVVKKAGRITDLNVVVAAEHNAISDFSFMLRSPQGRVVHLSTRTTAATATATATPRSTGAARR
jgi:subtilisin-like proprotein convertase family protein